MDNSLNSSGRMKLRKNDLLSNYDIQRIYLTNEFANSSKWKYKLYKSLEFIAISRIRKYKIILNKEDFAQTVKLSLWKAIKTFDPHKNFDFYRWLSWHINKSIRDFKNKQKRFYSINLSINSTTSTQDLEDKMVLLKEILDCENIVSSRDSRIIYSYYFEGRTLDEIGNQEGLSAEGVRKINNKTIKKLRKIMIAGE